MLEKIGYILGLGGFVVALGAAGNADLGAPMAEFLPVAAMGMIMMLLGYVIEARR